MHNIIFSTNATNLSIQTFMCSMFILEHIMVYTMFCNCKQAAKRRRLAEIRRFPTGMRRIWGCECQCQETVWLAVQRVVIVSMEPVMCFDSSNRRTTERMWTGSEKSVKFSLKHKKLAFIFNVHFQRQSGCHRCLQSGQSLVRVHVGSQVAVMKRVIARISVLSQLAVRCLSWELKRVLVCWESVHCCE